MIPSPAAPCRQALGAFLRGHRARLGPAAAGLPAGGRRRTPGLRREEVAQLAGISVAWYTWLEQGRDISVSAVALARLATALRLTPAERGYLFALAGKPDPEGPAASADDLPPALPGALALIACPAYLLDRTWTVRGWNEPAARLFGDGLSGERPNLLRFMILDPAAPRLVRDWEGRARRLVAEFRTDFARHLQDAAVRALVAELCGASPWFAREWGQQAVLVREGGERTFDHPLDGPLRFDQLSFTLADRPDMKLVLLAPARGEGR